MTFFSLGILASIVLASMVVPLFFSAEANNPNVALIGQAPSSSHLMGTDLMGRDVLYRVCLAGRTTMLIALAAGVLMALMGVTYGAMSAMMPRLVDTVLMGFLNVLISLPVIFVAVILRSIGGTSSVIQVTVIVAVTSWMFMAKMVWDEFVRLRGMEFVRQSMTLGAGRLGRFRWHLMPNALPTVVVIGTLGISQAVMLESALSFLGLGVPSLIPTWGNMLADGYNALMMKCWWLVVFPGGFLVFFALAVNLLGDILRDILDPCKEADNGATP